MSVYVAERHRPNPAVTGAPIVLALAAVALLAFDGDWLLVGVWSASGVLFGLLWQALERRRRTRTATCLLAVAGAVLMTWLGGLLFVPALLAAAIVAAVRV